MDESKWTIIGGAITAIVGAAVAAYLKISGQKHSQGSDRRKQLRDERREVVDELRQLLEESRKECHTLRDKSYEQALELTLCKVGRSRAEERIVSLEDLLDRHGVKFRKWNPDDSSASVDVQE